MTTSRASFSWARPAMRRACSSDVSRFRLRASGPPASLAGRADRSIEPEPLDLARDSGRDEAVDRLAAGDASADLAGRDLDGLDLEEADAVGPRERAEHRLEQLAAVAGAGGNAEPGQLEHAVR